MITEKALRDAAFASVTMPRSRYRYDPLQELFSDKTATVPPSVVAKAESVIGRPIARTDVTGRALCSMLRRWARSQLLRGHR